MKNDISQRTYAQIHLHNISHNIGIIKSHLDSSVSLIAVVKANAYGHGATEISKYIEDKVGMFAVAEINEAISLRKSGIKKPILIMGYTNPEYIQQLYYYKLVQSIYCFEYGYSLLNKAKENNIILPVHIAIDTGMNRIGFIAEDETEAEKLKSLYESGYFEVKGIYTHFSSADKIADSDKKYTIYQLNKFNNTIELYENMGMHFQFKHCANSSAAFMYKETHFDGVRCGISLYGLDFNNYSYGLKEAMTLKSTVIAIKSIKKGDSVSYGRQFVADRDYTLLTVGIGYADGYRRALSDNGYMYINNLPLKVAGRVCMDQTMLISDRNTNEFHIGETVDIFGFNTCQSATEFARLCNTINYEVVCNISPRVPRIYIY